VPDIGLYHGALAAVRARGFATARKPSCPVSSGYLDATRSINRGFGEMHDQPLAGTVRSYLVRTSRLPATLSAPHPRAASSSRRLVPAWKYERTVSTPDTAIACTSMVSRACAVPSTRASAQNASASATTHQRTCEIDGRMASGLPRISLTRPTSLQIGGLIANYLRAAKNVGREVSCRPRSFCSRHNFDAAANRALPKLSYRCFQMLISD